MNPTCQSWAFDATLDDGCRVTQWRRSISADTILDDFTFPERDAFISLYPQGYCNVDKMVRALGS